MWSGGVEWPSAVAVCRGRLLWPSGVAIWSAAAEKARGRDSASRAFACCFYLSSALSLTFPILSFFVSNMGMIMLSLLDNCED